MPSYSRAATDPLVCTTTLTAFLKVDAPTAVAVYRYADLIRHKGISAERRKIRNKNSTPLKRTA
jgi:hypothetical protein